MVDHVLGIMQVVLCSDCDLKWPVDVVLPLLHVHTVHDAVLFDFELLEFFLELGL